MTGRIKLEKIREQDFEAFYTLAGNGQVMKMISGKPQTREEARSKFHSLLKNNRWHDALGSFMVFERTSSELLGFAKLEITAKNLHAAELGYMLLPQFWGRGYGSEIAGYLLQIAESNYGLSRVYAITDPGNLASRKILLRLGFKSEKVIELDGLPREIFAKPLR